MTREEFEAELATTGAKLTVQQLSDLAALPPDQQQLALETYQLDGQPVPKSAWQVTLQVLKVGESIASALPGITGVISAVEALVAVL